MKRWSTHWYQSAPEWGVRPALALRSPRRVFIIRFGRDDRPIFSERYQGQHGIPRRYWYGPFGLTLIILNAPTKEHT